MTTYREIISTLTVLVFFTAQLYIPNFGNAYARDRATKDFYIQYSEEELLKLAQKDYNTAVNYAKQIGAIESEDDVYQLIAQNHNKNGIEEKNKKALDKRKINYKPSAFVGPTRTKMLKNMGFDIDKAAAMDSSIASQFLKQSGLTNSKKELISAYSQAIDLLLSLIIKNAYAVTVSRPTTANTNSRATSASTSGNVVTTAPGSYSNKLAGRMDDEDLSAIEDLYSQDSVSDAWDKAKASEQKGYKDLTQQIQKKKSEAMLYIAAGALLIAWGLVNLSQGQKMLEDKCQEPNTAEGSDKTASGGATALIGNAAQPKSEKLGTSAQCMITKPPSTVPELNRDAGCAEGCMYTANDEQGKSKKTTGLIMIAAGAALILMGMNKMGEAAAMEDEMAEQARKNADIDKAKANQLNKEDQKKRIQEKIIKYRMRTKQLEEKQNEQNQRQLQDAAQQAR